jgi:hypothetical protein
MNVFKVVSLTHRPPLSQGIFMATHRPPLLQEIFLVLVSVKGLSQTQDHIAARRIMSIKNSIDTVGDRTSDLSVLQRCVPIYKIIHYKIHIFICIQNKFFKQPVLMVMKQVDLIRFLLMFLNKHAIRHHGIV